MKILAAMTMEGAKRGSKAARTKTKVRLRVSARTT